jgi:UDP-GlcNAc:undecaprenyl-phosphate GlcNAc-1-phosphate transferase
MVWSYFFAALLAFLVGLYGTPIARAAALRFGVVDAPDGNLKTHQAAIPYLGGLAIYLAVLVPLCLFYTFDKSILSILLAGTLVLMLGLIDDFGVLTPAAKFIGQVIAAVVLVKGDILIRVESFPPYLNLALTLIWIIGMTNAFNIIDIMDGLAAGIALMSAIVLFVVALLNHHAMIAMMAVTLIGSLAGFLPYNFRPARIYMGDTGSMFLGLTLGALAIICDYSAHNWLAFFNPLLLFGVAIFDTAYVMVLRSLRRKSMFLGSKDHFALRLKLLGWSTAKVVVVSYLVAASLGACALWNMYLPFQVSIYLYCFIALIFLLFGWRLARVKVD